MPDEAAQRAAGYSAKPLIAKLGWKAGSAALAVNPPPHYAELTDAAPIALAQAAPTSGHFDFLHVFVRTEAELHAVLQPLERRMATSGMLWVSWPKKSSPGFVDLTEDGVRAAALPLGLVDIKVCAVDEDWSGLKLTRRKTA